MRCYCHEGEIVSIRVNQHGCKRHPHASQMPSVRHHCRSANHRQMAHSHSIAILRFVSSCNGSPQPAREVVLTWYRMSAAGISSCKGVLARKERAGQSLSEGLFMVRFGIMFGMSAQASGPQSRSSRPCASVEPALPRSASCPRPARCCPSYCDTAPAASWPGKGGWSRQTS